MDRDIYECIGCGLKHPKVEAGGIYYCPNRLCLASGAFNHRVEDGYHDQDGMLTEAGARKMVEACSRDIEERERWVDAVKRTRRRLEAFLSGGSVKEQL